MLRLAVVTTLLLSIANAGTFYVSTQGNDGNPGTQAQPWRTLQHAVDMIAPGDTILVQAGTYAGCRIGLSGGDQAKKTLQAAPGAHVLLNRDGRNNRHNSIIEVENFNGTTTDWVIAGFEIAGADRFGIDVRVTDRITLRGNRVHNSEGNGIFTAFSDHLLIQDNESDHNGNHGIDVTNSSVLPVVRGNRVHHNDASGIQFDGDLSEEAPRGHPRTGLIQSATIENNVIFENGRQGGSAINCDGLDDSMLRNNLLYNNHASGISLFGDDGTHASSNNKVYNNTIVMAPNSRYAVNIPDQGRRAPVGNAIENNILYTPDANRGAILVAAPNVQGFRSDFNIVVSRFSANNGRSGITLTQWQALGFDLHSIVSAPGQLFVDPVATLNFQLKTGSPAIDRGTALVDVLSDIGGVSRPQGGIYDIGCYEMLGVVILPV
jgi:hypothetical protein